MRELADALDGGTGRLSPLRGLPAGQELEDASQAIERAKQNLDLPEAARQFRRCAFVLDAIADAMASPSLGESTPASSPSTDIACHYCDGMPWQPSCPVCQATGRLILCQTFPELEARIEDLAAKLYTDMFRGDYQRFNVGSDLRTKLTRLSEAFIYHTASPDERPAIRANIDEKRRAAESLAEGFGRLSKQFLEGP